MTGRRRAIDGAAMLSESEREYLAAVEVHLRGVPRRMRVELHAEVAETLSSRPESVSFDGLVDALGEPVAMARRVRADAGVAGHVSMRRRWLAMRPAARGAQVVVGAALILGGLILGRYYTETPAFWHYCGGVWATEFESNSAAGETEYVIPFTQDGRVGALICLGADREGVKITNVSVPHAYEMALQPVGLETSNRRVVDLKPPVGDASDFRSYDPTEESSTYLVWWFEMEYCNIGGGGGVFWTSYDLEYRYRGRTRTVELEWPYRLTVTAECTTSLREQETMRSAAWRAQVPGLLPETLTNQNLRPESVSRDLCRYLRGVQPPLDHEGIPTADEFELLGERAVFRLDDLELAETLVDGAVLGICPEFADRRDEFVEMLGE